MANLGTLVQQLKVERDRAAKEVGRLDAALAALNRAGYKRRIGIQGGMSAAGRARIAAARRARWAKLKSGQRKRKLSAKAMANIRRAQKLRWKRFNAAKNS